jgi:hypothetical protein
MPKLTGTKKIKILGNNYNNTTITSLRKDLGIREGSIKNTNEIIRSIRKNVEAEKVIYNVDTGKVEKISLHDKPLVIRDFLNIGKVDKKLRDEIIINKQLEIENRKGETIQMFNKDQEFEEDDKVNNVVSIEFWIEWSSDKFGDQSAIRHIDFAYTGKIGDLREYNIDISRNGKVINQVVGDIDFSEVTSREEFDDIIAHSSFRKFNPEKNRFIKTLFRWLRIKGYTGHFPIFIFGVDVVTANGSRLDTRSMKMREICYDNIQINLFNEVIEIDNSDENCVIAYLKHRYPKIEIESYFDETTDGIDSSQVLKFCNKNVIKCIGYDILGNIIVKNDKANKKMKPLIYIAYNNHMYPIKNKLLRKQNTLETEFEYYTVDAIKNQFDNIIKNHIIPRDIGISITKSGALVNSFTHDDRVYHNNIYFDDCEKILKVFGCDDKMTNKITQYNVFDILCSLYNIPDYSSYNPIFNYYTISNFLYHKDVSKKWIKEHLDEMETIDKNKAFGFSLHDLDYIYICDLKYDNIIENPTGEINIDNIYLIEPEKSTILVDKTSWHTGDEFEYFDKKGIKYKLLIEIEAKRVENKYRNLIRDYYEKTKDLVLDDPTIIKNIINIFIGKLERGEHSKHRIEFNKLCNKDEASKSGYDYIELDNDYCICYDQIKEYDLKSKKMLAIQIKNRCKKILYEKMEELNIKDDQIVQINTDSITYIRSEINTDDIKNIDPTDFRQWKLTPYKRCKQCEYQVVNESIDMAEIINLCKTNNELHLGYAGCGKTHTIINKLLPELDKSLYKKVDKNYIILTPSHASLQFYKKEGYQCDVIQKYVYRTKLDPKYRYIVIDEIGMCNRKAMNLIYKLSREGRQIFAYGDFKQLLPPEKGDDKREITNSYLKLIFGKIFKKRTNHRNNFTTEYYDQLINNELNLIEEIQKHSESSYDDVDAIICYYNATVDKYNELILSQKGIDMETSGCKVICKTNKLRDYNIYNSYVLEVVEVDEDDQTIKLRDDCDEYILPLNIYRKIQNKKPFFKPAYARTIYSLQGSTIKNYYIAPEDLDMFDHPNTAYTIISRKSS